MSDQVVNVFPILRNDLNLRTYDKLYINLEEQYEHPDDDNYIRNKIHNMSISVIKNAKLNRKTVAWCIPNKDIVEHLVNGLKNNFPDTQFKVYLPGSKDPRTHIRAFWS